ncbi:glucose-1-phosphate thymidylyltransferase RfbA [Streptomyces sp. NPDC058067]|uniref:glucose-1-phosphate thymidylyltransferase RfbA n=1 Tax=Streptomyces sp. NPDC058067 TaxID=3346324 RepID=UPI0036E717E8
MRGILLAGGIGSRLHPITSVVSKQLLPVFDKPMIYYPLATLISSGIKEILIITRPEDSVLFRRLLGDGSQWGIRLEFAVQPRPGGIAQALIIAEDFLAGHPVALMLGDNFFYGIDFRSAVERGRYQRGGHIFGYEVADPSAYGVVELDTTGQVLSIEEKPVRPRSQYAVPGFYLYDAEVVEIARMLVPSSRGELEIGDVNREYLRRRTLSVTVLESSATWLDTGTVLDLADATNFVRNVEREQSIKVGCIEEAAWRAGFISDDQLRDLAAALLHTGYGEYLMRLTSVSISG